MLPSVQKVHRISIIPRGQALGYTLNLPEEDRYLKSKEELLDYMVVLLAGRVTEHIIFGQITTGASDDLHKVHEISRSMVTQYGMGTELMSKQLPADDYSMSDNTRRMVDEEQQYLTDLAHRRAMTIVGENRELLEALAQTLLENEVLEREDIERLVAAHRAAPAPAAIGRFSPLDPEPGPASVAASKRIEGQPGADSPS
jgi:cell division protease FtsH